MPLGKFFTLSPAGLAGCMVEVEGGSKEPGAPVVTHRPSGLPESPLDHQLWWVDGPTYSIRTKDTNFCLGTDKGGKIIVQPYQSMNRHQRWRLDDLMIRSRDKEKVLGLDDSEVHPGGHLYTQDAEEAYGDEWRCQYMEAQYMHVRHSHTGKVLDVAWEGTEPGAAVIVYDLWTESKDNQLWYEDKTGAIRSKVNDFLLTAGSADITVHPYIEKHKNQQWVVSQNAIMNATDLNYVLDITLPRIKFLQNIKGSFQVVPREYNGSAEQRWELLYADHCEATFGSPRSRFVEIVHETTGLLMTSISLKNLGIPSGRTDVILEPKKANSPKEQQWLLDVEQKKITSAVNGKSLDLSGEEVVLQPSEVHNHMQTWQFVAMTIQNGCNPELHLGASSCVLSPDSSRLIRVLARKVVPQSSPDLWKAIKAPASFFFIRTKMGDRVLDVKDELKDSGGDVILYDRKSPLADNQLWYEDEAGVIRSKLNGYVCDGSESSIKLRPYRRGAPDQQWIIFADVIKNRAKPNLCFDIYRERTKNGTAIIPYKFKNQENQKWLFEYV